MKKISIICLTILLASVIVGNLSSCALKSSNDSLRDTIDTVEEADTIVIESSEAIDSSSYSTASVAMSLPVGGDEISKTIRQQLLKLMSTEVYEGVNLYGEDAPKGKAYSGDTKDLKAICRFYSQEVFKLLDKQAKDDGSDGTMPPYSTDIKLQKVSETDSYIVFNESFYGYWGGAHGGVGGYGYIIFDKKTGKQVKSLLKPGSAKAMQQLIKEGLKSYFAENGEKNMTDEKLADAIMVDDFSNIPLPQGHAIAPTEEGLTFIYAQYEVACYAAGMPSFTIPYSKVKPYMTDEAKALVGLK